MRIENNWKDFKENNYEYITLYQKEKEGNYELIILSL